MCLLRNDDRLMNSKYTGALPSASWFESHVKDICLPLQSI